MTINTINKIFSKFSSLVLLYHSSYKNLPSDLSTAIHNVEPNELRKQLIWLKNHFNIVPIDELFSSDDIRGKAAITFDDAYQSFFDEAVPIFQELNIPCTVFIVGCTMDNKIFWRDKIRYIINKSLIKDFLDKNIQFCKRHKINFDNFYSRTKHKSVNSLEIDNLLDQYLETNNINLKSLSYCLNDRKMLSKDKLFTYGSHSYSHYVMSSLSEDQQNDEILKNKYLLEDIDINLSNIFSIPFGGDETFNETTLKLLLTNNYNGYMYSRNRVNSIFSYEPNKDKNFPILYADRFMPQENFLQFRKQLLKINFRSLLKYINLS